MSQYQTSGEEAATTQFLDGVQAAAATSGGRLSETSAREVLTSQSIRVPQCVQDALAVTDEKHHAHLLDAVAVGNREFQAAHGRIADPSLTVAAMTRYIADRTPIRELLGGGGFGHKVLDSASNLHHDTISLQPMAAIVAVMAMFNEVHPNAAYLPADAKSNEARLIIAQHMAQSDYGGYASGDNLNGVNAGSPYFMGERLIDLGDLGGASFNLTATARDYLPVSASNPALNILRGRTMVMVDGVTVATETRVSNGSGPNTMAGQVEVAGVSHAIAGSANSDTGDITFTFTPALPAGLMVSVCFYVDYERRPELAPTIGFEAEMFPMFAHPSRGLTTITPDAVSQFSQEAGLDAHGQMQLALRNQMAAERFYRANQKMSNLSRPYQAQWDYDFTAQIAQKDYAQLWFNLAPILALESQKMAERTIDHGIDTLFMTGRLSALCRGLPSTIWQSSGIVNRPGVYRMGKLFNEYDVYYVPPGKGIVEAADGSSSEILCMGRGSSVARNPLVYADPVPAMLIPLATGNDLNTRSGFYCRSLTEVNPHRPSAVGAAKISVINML